MPEYLSPGVYVEEIDAGPKPIEGVSTSTAGAVGVCVRGPTSGKPELVTSFNEFQRTFGGFLAEPDAAILNKWAFNDAEGGRWWTFPLAVKGFFDNGGQRLYVKRVSAASAVAAAAETGAGLASAILGDAAAGAQQLKLAHLIDVDTTTAIRVFNGDGNEIGAGYQVDAYDATSGTVDLAAGLAEAVKAGRGDYVVVHTLQDAATTKTLIFEAQATGVWGDDLRVRVGPHVGQVLNLMSDPTAGGDAASTSLTADLAKDDTVLPVEDAAGFAATDRVLVNGDEYLLSAVDAGAKTLTLDGANKVPDGGWPTGTVIKRMRPARNADAKVLHAWGAHRLYSGAIIEIDNGSEKEVKVVDSIAGDQVRVTTDLTTTTFEGHKVRVIEAAVTIQYVVDGAVEGEEAYGNLRLVDDGSLNYLVNHINERSDLVSVRLGPGFSTSDLTVFPAIANGGWLQFSGGDDKLSALTVDDFVGKDGGSGKRTGIQALEDIDEVSLCVVPGVWSSTVQGALIQHCELLKDRFAVIDPPDGAGIDEVKAFRATIDTKYAALYYPWLQVRDPLQQKNVVAPPSGHLIGIYARVDNERGVHKAPANEVVRGIDGKQGFAQDITKRQQDLLNPDGINALRFFPGRGWRVWGARCLTSDSAWKYINVRRLFIMVEESIDEGTQWVVFEPNDEALWARVRQSVGNFLTTLWRSGALQGTSAAEAFFVKCDRSTMSQDDIDNGRLICHIGIAPVKPAEFVIFRIQQKTIESGG